jgi:hypothetical protein
LRVLLAFALLFGAIQCVGACTAGDCNSALPPCHQHHGPHSGDAAKTGCTHVFQLSGIHRAPFAPAGIVAHLPPVTPGKVRLTFFATVHTPASSPPGSPFGITNVLRI